MSEHDERVCEEHRERIEDMEKTQIVICEDLKHIKDRIDNGLLGTIVKIWDKVNELSYIKPIAEENKGKIAILMEIKPIVEDNSFWVSKIKWTFIWLGIIGVLGGGLGMAMAILKRLPM